MGPGPDGMNYLTLEIWLQLPLFFFRRAASSRLFSCFKRRWQAHLFLSGPFHLVEANDGQRRADFRMTTANVSLPGHLPDCVWDELWKMLPNILQTVFFTPSEKKVYIIVIYFFSPGQNYSCSLPRRTKYTSSLKHLPPTGFKSFLLFQEPHLTKHPHEFHTPFEI